MQSDEDSAPERIFDTDHWPNWNGDIHNPNDSEENCTADDESDVEHNNDIEDPECAEQQDESASPNVPRLVLPIRKSNRKAEKVSVTANALETRRNNGGKKKLGRMRQSFTNFVM